MNVLDLIFFQSASMPDQVCLKKKDTDITYSEIRNRITNAALYFHNNIPEGKKLLIMLPNSVEFIVSLFGASLAGRTPVIIDTKLKQEVRDIIAENNISMIAAFKEEQNRIEALHVEDGSTIDYADFDLFYKPLDSKAGVQADNTDDDGVADHRIAELLPGKLNMDDEALILYTSGSTSKPKGVVNTQDTLYQAAMNYLNTVPISKEDVLLGVVPFFHSYGLGSCLIAGLCKGATLIIEEEFTPKKAAGLIEKNRVTVFHGVPFMYDLLSKVLRRQSYDISSLRLCISAGMRLGALTAENFYELTGSIIHQEYGSTESGTIAINLSDDLQKNIESVGKQLAGVDAKVLPDGVFAIKSQGRAIGYVNEEPFTDEWYRVGDMVHKGQDGYLTIEGRLKRMINIAGIKVNPMEVEDVIRQHDRVKDVYVSAGKDAVSGETVHALVVADPPVTAEELKRFCSSRLASFKIPRIITFAESLKKSQLGKVQPG